MEIKLVSDVQQTLKRDLFGPGWVHLGTAKMEASNFTHEKFFMLLMDTSDGQVYIEQYVDFPEFFVKIEDINLWNDLYMFFTELGLISIGIGKEKKIATKKR